MVIATRYRSRRSAARVGLLSLELRQQGEWFEVFKKKRIRLIVFVWSTTNIRFSFTFRMKTETVGPQSRWIEPPGSGQSRNADVNLTPPWQPVSNSTFKFPRGLSTEPWVTCSKQWLLFFLGVVVSRAGLEPATHWFNGYIGGLLTRYIRDRGRALPHFFCLRLHKCNVCNGPYRLMYFMVICK